MKWQLRNKLSPSPPPNAFPISWVSKFKFKSSKRDIPIPIPIPIPISPVKAQHYPHLPLPLGGAGVTVDTVIKDPPDPNPLFNPFPSQQHQLGDHHLQIPEFSPAPFSFQSQVGNGTRHNQMMRKSVYIGGGTHQQRSMERPPKAKPKPKPKPASKFTTAAFTRDTTCKIKALEEHKKKKTERQETPSQLQQLTAASMESFAVVKHSQDPQLDFRDSMMEMIIDKGITKPQEMEELLACYLTLNADDYHHLIIKVFRQVWRELDNMRTFNTQLQHLNI